MPPRAVLTSFGWAVVMWGCFGVHIMLLAHDLGHSISPELLLLSIGGYTLAWICGFLFIVAPAGGGVRELVLTALLAATLGHDAAFAVALISRLMMTVADLVCAFAAGASLGPAKLRELRSRGERAAEEPTPAG